VFDEVADYYDAWYEEPMGRFVVRVETKVLDELLPKKGRGLDVGGGTGVFSRRLMALSSDRWVVCLDPSRGMLRRARGRGVDVVCGIAGMPPFRPRAFDFAFAVTLIEFLAEPRKELEAIRETLRGGVFVLMVINRDSEWGKLYSKLAEEGEPVLRIARLYSVNEAVEILEKAGYEVLGVTGALEESPDEAREGEPTIRKGSSEGCGVAFIECKP